ncbi:hypothetical protein [Desmospora activa]|uniref:Uncharacterized protein n=1 Tax=Desmospora activa DSM 45169 TaxID=1121389 RepID=A0A2T4YXC1_9BACL|nr:hypothetical protein [Desmospora activa]PTM50662.1 hypothetical protein C8J48_3788 [Desmospora activa DSM 45169]
MKKELYKHVDQCYPLEKRPRPDDPAEVESETTENEEEARKRRQPFGPLGKKMHGIVTEHH